MRILVGHNFYQQPGGEDEVYDAEVRLLESHGQEVLRYEETNNSINQIGIVSTAVRAIWSRPTNRRMETFLGESRVDIAHFHNTFPLISPSVYYSCEKFEVPVVQSLHNPRLICPAATLYRNGKTCQDCLGKTVPWPGVLHACYRRSYSQTAVVAAMISYHRWLRTWENQVDLFIVFTDFYRCKFIEGGLPANKIVVKPHFVQPDPGRRLEQSGDYALFIGRLDVEKGIPTLLQAWAMLSHIPLRIRGDGNMLGAIRRFINENDSDWIQIINRLTREDLLSLIKKARFLIWPSGGYYETFGLVAIEAFACGIPVVASRVGAMQEIVVNGLTGLLFNPDDPEDLAAKVDWAWGHPKEMAEMGRNARHEYENKYTAEGNHDLIMQIYHLALERAKDRYGTRPGRRKA